MDEQYQPHGLEAAAQQWWANEKSFEVGEREDRDKFYCLTMFPYPSGRLHMGHVRVFTISDVIARYQRMQGKNVLQPMGWDAFGMPAENAAIERGVAPAAWTYENIDYMRGQLKRLGYAYDWSREVTTCRPEYYRWEQWLFTRMMKSGLVYRKNSVVNWDPVDQTVLANEQVIDGRGWRSGAPVERREIPQWFMKITAYADELLEALDHLPGWPEAVKTMQRNWIGRSEGLELAFPVAGRNDQLTVYTTRPDTLYGVTYMAVAAEHPLAVEAAQGNAEIAAFLRECQQVQASEAALETMEKKGMPLGIDAEHPLTGERVPIWVANFVLMGYGTGAVMAVPAHDQRDWEFATKYGVEIRPVIRPAEGGDVDVSEGAFVERGVLFDSGDFSGMDFDAAFAALAEHFESRGTGRRRVNYRLRDWGVSRQRYWGTPIPVIYCDDCGAVPVPEQDLPVVLPEDVDFTGHGSPLKDIPEFVNCACPECGKLAKRETDTFDTFVESSWYFARYACPDSDTAMLDARANYWTPVDQYSGGIEHAILHLLYSRFFQRVMRDEGLTQVSEPFTNLLTQGMVLKDGAKMSKSRGNTVDPQALIDEFGADTVRLFTMFAAPPEQALEWSDEGVQGAFRFLRRLWRLVRAHVEAGEPASLDAASLNDAQRTMRRLAHETIARVSDDIGRRYSFNTSIAACMELSNALSKFDDTSPQGLAVAREAYDAIVLMLSPMVPHVCHALWHALGHEDAVIDATWPKVDSAALERASVPIVVQVNGKVRARIEVAADAARDAVEAQALAEANVQRFLEGRAPRKVVFVPGKLVNVVV